MVTGATSGIGLAIVQQLLSEGNNVIGIGRDAAKIEGALSDSQKAAFRFLSLDLTQTAAIENMVQDALMVFGKLDGLVHCAGMEETLPLTLYTPDKVRQMYELNVFSAHELLRVYSKKKYSNDGSSVVMFSSVMGMLGQSGKTAYCATKTALIGLTKAAALELAKRKIRVNAILPGVVDTPMTRHLFEQLEPAGVQAITEMHPLGLGTVADITPMVSLLLSTQSRWITGQSFVLDGGYSIQ